jgi:hypothetical protein
VPDANAPLLQRVRAAVGDRHRAQRVVGAGGMATVFHADSGAPLTRLLTRPGEQWPASFTPDGRWLAFDSDETGTREVYLQRFPGPGERLRVSPDGGRTPVCTKGGRELVYWTRSGLVAVALAPESDQPIGPRRPLAVVNVPAFSELAQFDLSADGRTLVLVQAPPAATRFVVRTGITTPPPPSAQP